MILPWCRRETCVLHVFWPASDKKRVNELSSAGDVGYFPILGMYRALFGSADFSLVNFLGLLSTIFSWGMLLEHLSKPLLARKQIQGKKCERNCKEQLTEEEVFQEELKCCFVFAGVFSFLNRRKVYVSYGKRSQPHTFFTAELVGVKWTFRIPTHQ